MRAALPVAECDALMLNQATIDAIASRVLEFQRIEGWRERQTSFVADKNQTRISPFKSDAEKWETAFFLLDRLANKYPELQREFNIQWQLKYEIPFGGWGVES